LEVELRLSLDRIIFLESGNCRRDFAADVQGIESANLSILSRILSVVANSDGRLQQLSSLDDSSARVDRLARKSNFTALFSDVQGELERLRIDTSSLSGADLISSRSNRSMGVPPAPPPIATAHGGWIR
jgi:hypothetical protein